MRRYALLLTLALAACGQSQAQPPAKECPACPECKPEPPKPPTEAEAWAVIVERVIQTDPIGDEACAVAQILALADVNSEGGMPGEAATKLLRQLMQHIRTIPGARKACYYQLFDSEDEAEASWREMVGK